MNSSASNGFSPQKSRIEPLSTRGIMAAGSHDARSPHNDSKSANKSSMRVEFIEENEAKEKRERFLTAKYGAHQMALIRKRLTVEMWIFEQLQALYGCTDESESHDVDLDLDELLDLEDDSQRRIFLQKLLINAKSSTEDVDKFVNELLSRTKVL